MLRGQEVEREEEGEGETYLQRDEGRRTRLGRSVTCEASVSFSRTCWGSTADLYCISIEIYHDTNESFKKLSRGRVRTTGGGA